MGGLLFNTKRLPKEEFLEYLAHVLAILDIHNIKYFIPKYFKNKEDFGDLDIVIYNTVSDDLLKKMFPCESFKNGNCLSFNYNNFQIDFIKHKAEDFESAQNYYCYNDLGNLIGRLCKTIHPDLKFGPDGLRFVYYKGTKKLGEIILSKNIDQILDLLGLDVNKFHNGFETLEEVFDFIIKSFKFNPYIYDMEHLNKINRDRNKKRKTYLTFLDYIQPLKKDYNSVNIFEHGDIYKTLATEKLNRFFFKNREFLDFIEEKDREFRYKEFLKTKFNGDIIMKLIPDLEGKRLGKFINHFKEYIDFKFGNFDKYVEEIPSEYIEKEIVYEYKFFDFNN